MEPYLVVFVCTGNICRSPMAEGIMKHLLVDEAARTGSSAPLKVISAGTHAMDGLPASENAVRVAADDGIDISSHRSRLLTDGIVNAADLLLTMERRHTELVTYSWPLVTSVTELGAFGRSGSPPAGPVDVMDPIGGGIPVYRTVYGQIRREVARVAPIIMDRARAKRIGGGEPPDR